VSFPLSDCDDQPERVVGPCRLDLHPARHLDGLRPEAILAVFGNAVGWGCLIPSRGIEPRGGAMTEVTYSVPGIHCDHCGMSIREEVSEVDGVEGVDVDLESKFVTIRGRELDDAALRAAIEEAGYEAA
jgi:copper chaperone